MPRRLAVFFALITVSLSIGRSQPPCCRAKPIQVRGSIEKIQIVPAAGTPFLEIRTAGGREKILLGSLRYLMEQSFDPHAGDEVFVDGVRDAEAILALRIEIPARKIKVQLREPSTCMPMWRRMGHRGH